MIDRASGQRAAGATSPRHAASHPGQACCVLVLSRDHHRDRADHATRSQVGLLRRRAHESEADGDSPAAAGGTPRPGHHGRRGRERRRAAGHLLLPEPLLLLPLLLPRLLLLVLLLRLPLRCRDCGATSRPGPAGVAAWYLSSRVSGGP